MQENKFSVLFSLALAWLALAAFAPQGGEADQFIEFRDTPRPGTQEASSGRYAIQPWAAGEKAIARADFARIHALAPGLLPRGAAGGRIAVYRARLRTYAKGGRQRMMLDRKMFFYPQLSFPVLLHESVHTADSAMRISGSVDFRAIFEPEILKARALLKHQGLTPAMAAALPIGARRRKIERLVRQKTALPSAYAARNLAECLAEVVAFWLNPDYAYTPPEKAQALLRPFVSTAPAANRNEARLYAAETLYQQGKYRQAVKLLSQIIAHDPDFYQAWSARGYAYLKLHRPALAERDLKQARDLVPPLQSGYGFYDSEWKRVHKAVYPQKSTAP